MKATLQLNTINPQRPKITYFIRTMSITIMAHLPYDQRPILPASGLKIDLNCSDLLTLRYRLVL